MPVILDTIASISTLTYLLMLNDRTLGRRYDTLPYRHENWIQCVYLNNSLIFPFISGRHPVFYCCFKGIQQKRILFSGSVWWVSALQPYSSSTWRGAAMKVSEYNKEYSQLLYGILRTKPLTWRNVSTIFLFPCFIYICGQSVDWGNMMLYWRVETNLICNEKLENIFL